MPSIRKGSDHRLILLHFPPRRPNFLSHYSPWLPRQAWLFPISLLRYGSTSFARSRLMQRLSWLRSTAHH